MENETDRDLIKEWCDFARIQVTDPEFGEQQDLPVPTEYFVAFGIAMKRIADANIDIWSEWAASGPGGSECRQWYRAWLALYNHPNHNSKLVLPGFDEANHFEMMMAFILTCSAYSYQSYDLLAARDKSQERRFAEIDGKKLENGMYPIKRIFASDEEKTMLFLKYA